MLPWNASALSESAKWPQRLAYFRGQTSLSDAEWSKRRVSLEQLLEERLPDPIDDIPYEGTDFSELESGYVPEYCPSYQHFDRSSDHLDPEDESIERTYIELENCHKTSTNLRKRLKPDSRIDEPDRTEVVAQRFVRDRRLVEHLKILYSFRCQVCDRRIRCPRLRIPGYSEGHHIMPLENSGPDVLENLIIVCPNHHIELQHGGRPLSLEKLRLVRHEISQSYIDFHNEMIFVPNS